MHRFWVVILLSLAPLAAVHAAAPATANTYEVEVMVFENRLPDLEGDEQWVGGRGKTAGEVVDGITLGSPPSGSDLMAAAAALQNDARYRLLVHRRWLQAANNKPDSSPVLLRTDTRDIDGYVRFYMSRFLHVEVNLAFQPQVAALGGIDAVPSAYRLTEQRRVKSQELHYFDHPKFGVLVRVLPATAAALGSER